MDYHYCYAQVSISSDEPTDNCVLTLQFPTTLQSFIGSFSSMLSNLTVLVCSHSIDLG